MFSTYRITPKGKQTRSHLLQHLHPNEELTRDELVQRSGLTYEQVRRQTKNLCVEGTIESRMEAGQRYYRLRQNLTGMVSSFLLVLTLGWLVPVDNSFYTDPDHDPANETFTYPR